jgi:nitrite reductase (NADH) small subunit
MDRPVPQSWTRICEVSEIPRLGSRVLEREAGNVAIFRTAQDKVFALLDHCPHKGGALSQGIVARRQRHLPAACMEYRSRERRSKSP